MIDLYAIGAPSETSTENGQPEIPLRTYAQARLDMLLRFSGSSRDTDPVGD
jgi:hypothetical protein